MIRRSQSRPAPIPALRRAFGRGGGGGCWQPVGRLQVVQAHAVGMGSLIGIKLGDRLPGLLSVSPVTRVTTHVRAGLTFCGCVRAWGPRTEPSSIRAPPSASANKAYGTCGVKSETLIASPHWWAWRRTGSCFQSLGPGKSHPRRESCSFLHSKRRFASRDIIR